MSPKLSFNLLALVCTIPAALLAFKARFIENYKSQCINLLKKEKPDYKKDIRIDYRFLAFIMLNIKENWLDIFGNPESEIVKKIEFDKSDAVRGLSWFLLTFIFALLAIFFPY